MSNKYTDWLNQEIHKLFSKTNTNNCYLNTQLYYATPWLDTRWKYDDGDDDDGVPP